MLKKKSDSKVKSQRLKQQRRQDIAQLRERIDERERELRRSLQVLSGRKRVRDDEQLQQLHAQMKECQRGDAKS
jgi:hypothetical protein